MCVCNKFKPSPRGWDHPEKANAMPHVAGVGFIIFKLG